MKPKKKQQNIIVFCAHSDDQILGPGGTLAKYAKEGKDIYTVIFSYGEAGLPHFKRKVAVETRVKEARDANKIIGGKDVYFLGLKEGRITEEVNEKKIIKKINALLLDKRPEKIFTHSPSDPHPDHRDVLDAVLKAVDKLRLRCDVYCFDIWNPLTFRKSNLPRLYVDITGTIGKKIEAIRAFRSQRAAILTIFWGAMLKSFINGMHIKNSRYAERFYKIR